MSQLEASTNKQVPTCYTVHFQASSNFQGKKKRLKLIFLNTDLMLKWREEEDKIWRSAERTEGGTC